ARATISPLFTRDLTPIVDWKTMKIFLSDEPWAGQLTHVYNPQLDTDGRGFDRFENTSGKWDTSGEYIAVFPNTLLGVHKDHIFAMIVEPVENGKTCEHVSLFYSSPAMTAPDMEELRVKNAKLWKSVFVEDISVVEAMQKGRSASGFDGGRFSPVMDEATHQFHVWVAGQLLEADAKLSGI
ncbi:MAG: RHO alpha subunit C-terminal catalytic domain-containing protein, partial [Rhizobiaceae bacterium]